MKEDLKPCPFCGSTQIQIQNFVYYGNETAFVECMECEAKTRWFKKDPAESHIKKATIAWNKRA